MRKVLNNIKNRLTDHADNMPGSSYHLPGVPSTQVHDQARREFPDEADLYRYRKQRGVNLGSWFVLERWITESPFRCARAPAQSDLDIALGADAKSILEHHWNSWITENDWAWIAARGINTVRIPIGYYHLCGADPTILHGTDFAGLEDVFVGAWNRITDTLSTAHRFGIGVLFDLHAAPGKQNADAHSGTSLEPSFFKNSRNMSHTFQVLSTFVTHITAFARAHDPPLPNLVGIELLNEPQPGPHNDELKKWYLDAFHVVRAISPDLPLYISDSWMTDQYAAFIKTTLANTNTPFIVLDHHLYRCFTSADISAPAAEHARRLRDTHDGTPQMFARVARELEEAGGGLVVGEWSAALNPGSLRGSADERAEKDKYARAQLDLYEEQCSGWFFWTYKKERDVDTGWSFRDAVEAGIMPYEVRPRRNEIEGTEMDRDVRKEQKGAEALGQHRSYWSQYPGNYEHWRYQDGYTKGWDDAMLFAFWTPDAASEFVDELGFKGPWLTRRAREHIAEKGNGDVWEFKHGFSQGYRAALEDLSQSK